METGNDTSVDTQLFVACNDALKIKYRRLKNTHNS